jgi:type II secretory pathway pseudopilin PulG
MFRATGTTLLEAAVYILLASLVAAAVLPALANARASALAAAGARQLAVSLHALRWKAVAQGRAHGFHFTRDATGWCWYEVRDGNGNGLRTDEIADGTDPTLSGPQRLEHAAAGVVLGFPDAGPVPRIPPADGWIDDLDDPVRIGGAKLLSFSPLGSSSTGTLYVTDGRLRLYAIVVYGRTARIRVWRYLVTRGRWTR